MKRICNIPLITVVCATIISLSISSCRPTKHIPEGEYLLANVKYNCDNPEIDQDELQTTNRQEPNRKLLSTFRLRLLLYNIAKSGKQRDVKDKIANAVGEEPVIYNESDSEKTMAYIKSYLQSQSYYSPEVSVEKKQKKRKVKLNYSIRTGVPHVITKLDYDIIDSKISELVLLDTSNSLIHVNQNFNTDILQDERERIVKMLKANGYYYFSVNNVHYYADTLENKHEVKLTVAIRRSFQKDVTQTTETFNSQYIRNIYIYANHDPQFSILYKDFYMSGLDTLVYDGYNIIYSNTLPLNPSTLVQACFFHRGDRYNIENIEKTHFHLANLKQFKLINIKLLVPDDLFLFAQKVKFLDVHIYLTPQKKQSYTVDLEGISTSGSVGMLSSVSYNNRNLLGGAQIFSLRGEFSFQSLRSESDISERGSIFNILEYGGEANISIPRLMVPFYENYEFIKNNNPKTKISLSYNFQDRLEYTLARGSTSFGYYWKGAKNKNITHYVNLLELSIARISNLDEDFKEQIENLYIRYSYQDHLMTVFSYDLVFNNQNINKNRDFDYLWFNIETSGNIPTAIHKLSKLPMDGSSYKFLGVEYSQFIKTDIDYRHYKIINKKQSFVLRSFFGIGIPFGNSTTGLPFIKKYYIGGANDIRAWQIRSIGPGSYTSSISNYDQIADMKIMLNLEYRFDIVSILEGALFIDTGNIWAIDKRDNREGALFEWDKFYKEIAIGTGFGVRFDISLFIVRFDFGVPLYDPAYPLGERWLSKFSTLELSDFTVNFGIGYPF